MGNDNNKCIECQIKSNAVSILNNNELSFLEQGCSQIEFSKSELIFKESTPANQIAYLRDGFVKLSKKGIGGRDFILSVAGKGAYLGIQNLSKKSNNYYFSASAITNAKICFIDIASFEKLMKRNGVFATEVISYIFEDEMNYFDRLVNNVQQQLPGRLANTLLYFKNQVYNENPFCLNITQSELASLIGTTRESISRLLKEFQEEELIQIEKTRITVLEEDKLEKIKQKG